MVGYRIEIIIILYSINVTQFKYAIEKSHVDEKSKKPFESRKNISQTLKRLFIELDSSNQLGKDLNGYK